MALDQGHELLDRRLGLAVRSGLQVEQFGHGGMSQDVVTAGDPLQLEAERLLQDGSGRRSGHCGFLRAPPARSSPPSWWTDYVKELRKPSSRPRDVLLLPRQAHQARIPAGRGGVDARHLLHHQPGQVVAAVGAVLDQRARWRRRGRRACGGGCRPGRGGRRRAGRRCRRWRDRREGDGGVGDGADQAAAEVVVGDQGVVVGGEGGGELLEQRLEGRGEAGERAAGLEPERVVLAGGAGERELDVEGRGGAVVADAGEQAAGLLGRGGRRGRGGPARSARKASKATGTGSPCSSGGLSVRQRRWR